MKKSLSVVIILTLILILLSLLPAYIISLNRFRTNGPLKGIVEEKGEWRADEIEMLISFESDAGTLTVDNVQYSLVIQVDIFFRDMQIIVYNIGNEKIGTINMEQKSADNDTFKMSVFNSSLKIIELPQIITFYKVK